MPPAILTDFALKTPAASAAAAISFALKVQNQKSDCLYKSMGPWVYVCVCACCRVFLGFWQVYAKSYPKNELLSLAYR